MAEPMAARQRPPLVFEDGRVINAVTRAPYDLEEAIAVTEWITARPGTMPAHQYSILGRTQTWAWDVIATTIHWHPDSYLAYFRGYQRPMRYLDLPEHRYWRTAARNERGVTHMLNRCTFDSVEPPRRVDEGAGPMPWSGDPWDLPGAPPAHSEWTRR
jgi:hypothetical protein